MNGPMSTRGVPLKLDYTAVENHVAKRGGLSDSIRETLLESDREQWMGHPRFHGKAAFWMTIHRDLLQGAAHLRQGMEQLLDIPDTELADTLRASRLRNFARRLIDFAHHHHEIEDHGYFPQFVLLYPSLDRALALLDGDHRVLNEALDETDTALGNLGTGEINRDVIAKIHDGCSMLDQILNRHIRDEEDIIIPILLKHG